MIDLFQARRESHEARELGHEFKIQEGGVSLEVPRVEGQAFYPSGDAPRMTRDGTPMENIKEGLADLPKAVGSAGAGLAAGAAGLPGDLVGLAGGLAKFMFPGDQGRIEAAAETLSKISETAGSEFFLGLYRDFVNNSDASLEDKQMMLDVAEGASFGSIPGAGAVAKGSADTIRSGVVKAGEAAQARLDEAAGSTTLAAGVDVGKGIDQAIAAAGRQFADAQARYFETGKFEPPTAENPVSVVRPTETEPGIIAFHGSGADFDEFRLEMIGTGEGAQAYGYGLYFTDSEDIAKFYRDSIGRGRSSIVYDGSSVKNAREVDGLTDREMILDSIAGEMAFFDQKPANVIERKIRSLKAQIENPDSATLRLAESDAEAQELVDLIRRSAQRDLEIYESLDPDKFTRGKMYKVALSPKPDELLDYDKSLRQQPKFADALKPIYEEYGVAETADIGTLFETIKNRRGMGKDPVAMTVHSAQSLSERLSAAGIPGIKYRAAGSRGAGVTDEAAERNYVIFDDKAVKILEKYGIVGPVAITAAAAGQSNDNEDGGI